MPGSHNCPNCKSRMPVEDGHTLCMTCLGPDHALASKADPSSCSNCLPFSTRTLLSRVSKVTGDNASSSSRGSSEMSSQLPSLPASTEPSACEAAGTDPPTSGKKHRKRKHEAYEALANTMASLVKEVSSLASSQQWVMQQLTERQTGPLGHSGETSASLQPIPQAADDDVELLSVMASDNLDGEYTGDLATSPHPSDLSSGHGSALLSIPPETPGVLSGDEFFGLMCRATKRLHVDMPTATEAQPSLFDRRREAVNKPCSLPVLPDLTTDYRLQK